jgi:hypothetical protein
MADDAPMTDAAAAPAPAETAAAAPAPPPVDPEVARREKVLAEYRKVLLQHKETDGKVRQSESRLPRTPDHSMPSRARPGPHPRSSRAPPHPSFFSFSALASGPPAVREETKVLKKDYDKTEDDLKALQSVGQIIGEVLRQLDADRFIVKASSGPRYVVGCRNKIDHTKLIQGTRVSLDMTTLTIMRHLPREVDPTVYAMQAGMRPAPPLPSPPRRFPCARAGGASA